MQTSMVFTVRCASIGITGVELAKVEENDVFVELLLADDSRETL